MATSSPCTSSQSHRSFTGVMEPPFFLESKMSPRKLFKKSTKPLFAGVDPGKTGFIAAYDGEEIVKFWPLPWLDKEPDLYRTALIAREVKAMGVVYALVEHQQAMVYEGAVGAFTLGGGFFAVRMALHMAGVRFEIITSTEWKRSLGIPAANAKPVRMPKKPAKPKRLKRHSDKDFKDALRKYELDVVGWKEKKVEVEKQRRANKTKARRDRKWKAIAKAQQLFPDVDFRLSPRHKNDHDGKVESALISVVAHRRYMGAT